MRTVAALRGGLVQSAPASALGREGGGKGEGWQTGLCRGLRRPEGVSALPTGAKGELDTSSKCHYKKLYQNEV